MTAEEHAPRHGTVLEQSSEAEHVLPSPQGPSTPRVQGTGPAVQNPLQLDPVQVVVA